MKLKFLTAAAVALPLSLASISPASAFVGGCGKVSPSMREACTALERNIDRLELRVSNLVSNAINALESVLARLGIFDTASQNRAWAESWANRISNANSLAQLNRLKTQLFSHPAFDGRQGAVLERRATAGLNSFNNTIRAVARGDTFRDLRVAVNTFDRKYSPPANRPQLPDLPFYR